MEPTRILIVEPARLSREGLRLMLRQPGWSAEAVACVADHAAATDAALPSLVVWGPGVAAGALKAGMAALRPRRADEAPVAHHVVLASVPTAGTVRTVAALGVSAILLDDISVEVLQRSIELVMLGQRMFPLVAAHPTPEQGAEVLPFPTPAGRLAPEHPVERGTERGAEPAPSPRPGVALSNREAQILRHLVSGASNKAIARGMRITEATVKVHVKAVVRKLGVANRTQAAVWALRNPEAAPAFPEAAASA